MAEGGEEGGEEWWKVEEEEEGRKIVKGEGGQKGNRMSWEGGASRWEERKEGNKGYEKGK